MTPSISIVGGTVLHKVLTIKNKIEDLAILFSTVIVVGIISIGAIARYFFSYNLAGVEEILGLAGAWMFFLGAVRASRKGDQIKADVLSSFIKNHRTSLALDIAKNTFSCIICAFFFYWSIEFLRWEIESGGHTPALGIPLLVGKISLFISCFGMMVYTCRDLINNFKTKGK